MRLIGLLLFLVLVVIAAVFATLNAEAVPLDFYFFTTQIPQALGLGAAVLAGMSVGVLAALPIWLGQQRRLRAVRREMKQLEQELQNLRALPLRDGI